MALPANPIIHLRSEDVVTDPVSAWPDSSGNSNDFDQPTGSSQPVLVADALNGFQVVRFDGTDDVVRREQTLNQPVTYAVVCRMVDATAVQSVFGGRNPTGTNQSGNLIGGFDEGGTTFDNWVLFAGAFVDSGIAMDDTDWHVVIAVYNGASSQLEVDAVTTLGNAGSRDASRLRLGARSDSGGNKNHWDGDVAEFVVWDRALDATEISDTQDFFDAKYFPAAPSAPANPAAAAQSSTVIQVTWDDVADETGYRVERSLNGTSGWTDVSGNLAADTVLYDDTGLTAETQYFYRVFAFNGGGDSPASTTVNATTDAGGAANRMGGTGAIRKPPRTPR